MDRPQLLLAAAGPLAYVSADTEAEVVLVRMTSGRIVRRIPTLQSPFSIERVRVAPSSHDACLAFQ